jgi:two-component system, NarL family, sensor kinase
MKRRRSQAKATPGAASPEAGGESAPASAGHVFPYDLDYAEDSGHWEIRAFKPPRWRMPQRAPHLARGPWDGKLSAVVDGELLEKLPKGTLRDFIQALPVGLAIVHMQDFHDLATWRLAAANPLARRVIGPSLSKFLYAEAARSFPHKNKVEEVYYPVIDRKVVCSLGWTRREIGGITRFFSISAFPGPPNHIGFLIQDVSRDLEVRKTLEIEKTRRQMLDQAIKTFLWRADPETLQTLSVSDGAQELLGYWPEHWCKMPNFWLDHIYPADREMVRTLVRRQNLSPSARFDYRMKAADGRVPWLHAAIHVEENKAGKEELAGVMVDITARKIAEEAACALTAKLLRSQDDERRHIARELHDSLGQYLSVLSMNVGMLSRTVGGLSDQQKGMFAETAQLLENCLREVRTVSYLMHPPMLDEVGLLPALEWYAAGFSERSEIQVKIDAAKDLRRLPKTLDMALFRITQEALTNVYRHSGSRTATILLKENESAIVLEIADQGTGIEGTLLTGIEGGDGMAGGVGIRGMRERMRDLGGMLKVVSDKNGTVVRASVPWSAQVFARESGEEHEIAAAADA